MSRFREVDQLDDVGVVQLAHYLHLFKDVGSLWEGKKRVSDVSINYADERCEHGTLCKERISTQEADVSLFLRGECAPPRLSASS